MVLKTRRCLGLDGAGLPHERGTGTVSPISRGFIGPGVFSRISLVYGSRGGVEEGWGNDPD